MQGFVETKKVLYLDKEAKQIIGNFEILLQDMLANGCEEVDELLAELNFFKSKFEKIVIIDK